MTPRLVPELRLADPAMGRDWLARVLGFAPDGGAMRLGDQRLLVAEGSPDGRHGHVDHLALAVPDLAAALEAARGHGATLAAATPDGPLEIQEFGATGVGYVFVEGPEGANIELIAPLPPGLGRGPGHDHVGLSTAVIGPMREFLAGLGLPEVASHVLDRPEGRVDVCFMGGPGGVVEVYSLPGTRADPSLVAGEGFWGLRIEGLDGPRQGPEGIEVRPL